MSCPLNKPFSVNSSRSNGDTGQDDTSDIGVNYWNYLQLDKLLGSQLLLSQAAGEPVHDEHLFIIVHQAYELWFKQIIFEVDSVREVFMKERLNERRMLNIIKQTSRVALILRLLVGQIEILETMTPLDFLDFREHLDTASGFQSLQFRLFENKLGLRKDMRVKTKHNYSDPYRQHPQLMRQIEESEEQPSLSCLVERWLERTPGLSRNGFNFWARFHSSVKSMLHDEMNQAKSCADKTDRETQMKAVEARSVLFDSIFNVSTHEALRSRGDRRWSHKAFQGALMISFYRMEPRFNQPYQLLNILMDIDELLIKWRNNHVQIVQRMIGSQQLGTGGSAGYHYLRATVSDRYKVFLDLFNLSTFLVPRRYVPELSRAMLFRLSRSVSLDAEQAEQVVAELPTASTQEQEDNCEDKEEDQGAGEVDE